jgi:hypothetical protein
VLKLFWVDVGESDGLGDAFCEVAIESSGKEW